MKKFLYVFLSILVCFSCNTNPRNTFSKESIYSKVDERSKQLPDSLATYQEIAAYLTNPFSEDDEKIRAIHIWITHNIKYDLSKLDDGYQYDSEEEILSQTLKDRSGVCFHYTELFHGMCQSIGIQSYRISGYTLDHIGLIADESHAWNGVVVDSNYYLVDNTWAAGYIRDSNYVPDFKDKYFLVEPKDFIKSHMPFDYLWQFLTAPISHEEFKEKKYKNLDVQGGFGFKDSILRHEKLDRLTALLEENRRIEKTASNNNLITDELYHNENKIQSILYNKWLEKMNHLSKDLNLAVQGVNKTVALNNRFIAFANNSNNVTEVKREAMQKLISEAAQCYKHTIALLNESKKRFSKLVYNGNLVDKMELCKKEKEGMLTYIKKLESKMSEIKPSLKLNALYADIELE